MKTRKSNKTQKVPKVARPKPSKAKKPAIPQEVIEELTSSITSAVLAKLKEERDEHHDPPAETSQPIVMEEDMDIMETDTSVSQPEGENIMASIDDSHEYPDFVERGPGQTPPLPDTIIKRIKENKYTDLNDIYRASENFTGKPEQLTIAAEHNEKGTSMVLKADRRRKIFSLHQWNKAFFIYATIRGEAHPKEYGPMMKYMQQIADISDDGGNWYYYDIQFRWKKAQKNSLTWDKLHEQTYLKSHFRTPQEFKITPFPNNNYVTNQKGRGFFRRQDGPSKHKLGYCWRYQEGKKCTPGCPHKHQCELCDRQHFGKQCYGRSGRSDITSTNRPTSAAPNTSRTNVLTKTTNTSGPK